MGRLGLGRLQGSGGRPPDPSPGALPLDLAGGSAPRPPFRLALHALAIVCPPFGKSWIRHWLGLGLALVLGLALWTENSRLSLKISVHMDGK